MVGSTPRPPLAVFFCHVAQVLSVRWASDDPNPTAVVGRKRAALDIAEAAALAAWDALPAEERNARLAMARAARARKLTDVADRMPSALLNSGGHSDDVQDDGSIQSFEELLGRPLWHTPQDSGQEQQQQQQQLAAQDQAAAVEWGEADWQAYWAANPSAAEAWQQQQQQQPGLSGAGNQTCSSAGGRAAWYQGWRKRPRPEQTAPVPTTMPAPVSAPAPAGGEAGAAEALGLLTGYGSSSESSEAEA